MSGNPNPTICGRCGTRNPPNSAVCAQCGAPLVAADSTDASLRESVDLEYDEERLGQRADEVAGGDLERRGS